MISGPGALRTCNCNPLGLREHEADGWMDAWIEGRMDGWIAGRTHTTEVEWLCHRYMVLLGGKWQCSEVCSKLTTLKCCSSSHPCLCGGTGLAGAEQSCGFVFLRSGFRVSSPSRAYIYIYMWH